MRKVLVSGAAGFVGRHLVRRLLERGDEVHAVDRVADGTGGRDPESGWPLFEPRDYGNFHFYREDCRRWFSRVQDREFDYAFHLAAMVGGRLMIERAPLAAADDLSIDAAYWGWAHANRPGKTVCFSSSAVYPVRLQGPEHHVLLKESMVDFNGDLGIPDMIYGWAKLTCEYLARQAYLRHGLKSVCYRPFSGYGEDQDDAYPVPDICGRILASRETAAVRVWGTGAQMRDFIHVEDCVDGVLLTVDKIDDGGALNLSTGIYTTFARLIQMGAEHAGYRAEIVAMADKPAGVHARGGDTAKQIDLGFRPKITLAAGLGRVLDSLARTGRYQGRNR